MIHIVVALIHEALPLITHYRLRPLREKHPFSIYRNETITLVVSGMGKTAAAAAVGYLQALNRNHGPAAWLNIGIAGHQQADIAQGFIAHRIQEKSSGRAYYPPQVFPFSLPSCHLITVDSVEKDYLIDSAYDMEASAYYSAAIRSSPAEFIQSYKIVSDHPQAPAANVTKGFVRELIEGRMVEIEHITSILCSEIQQYRKIHAPHPQADKLLHRWHFTDTQKIQVKRLLERVQILYENPLPPQLHAENHANAKTFLNTLTNTLAEHQLKL